MYVNTNILIFTNQITNHDKLIDGNGKMSGSKKKMLWRYFVAEVVGHSLILTPLVKLQQPNSNSRHKNNDNFYKRLKCSTTQELR